MADNQELTTPNINPIKLMTAITAELSKQAPEMTSQEDMMNAVIEAANSLAYKVNQIPCVSLPSN